MNIASVEVLHVGSEVSGSHTVVRLATDTGVVGLGQSGGWGYQHAVGEIIADLRPVLLGCRPFPHRAPVERDGPRPALSRQPYIGGDLRGR